MKVGQLGEFIRSQRRGAQMSLRALSKVAGVSLPYLSQIERGLRRPSADIMQAIAKALRVSAQTLYVQAGILDEQPHPDVHEAVMGDPGLTERQKQALLSVYDSFREETGRRRLEKAGEDEDAGPDPSDVPAPKRLPRSNGSSAARASRAGARRKASGGTETQADTKPSPGSPPSSRSQSTTRTRKSSKGGTR